MLSVAYFTSLFKTPGYGPATVARHLQQYRGNALKINFFSDDVTHASSDTVFEKKRRFLSRIPGYWLLRSLIFYNIFSRREESFDLVICSNAFEAVFMALFKVKASLVVMINDDNYLYTRYNFKKAVREYKWMKVVFRFMGFYIEKTVAARAKAVIVCSEYLKREVVHKYGVHPRRVYVLYPGVETGFFKKAPPEVGKEHLNVLFMKRDWRRGGLKVLAQALGQTKSPERFSLYIAGNSKNEEQKIRLAVRKAGFLGEIHFLGLLDKISVRNQLQMSDVFILPSLQEAFGISLLEAMAAGVPVIASYAGGIPEAVGDAGLFFPPGDSKALADLLDDMAQDKLFLRSRINAAFNHVQRFDVGHLYENLEKICKNIKEEEGHENHH